MRTKRAKSVAAAKRTMEDLPPKKASNVKGGRITNIRANASGVPTGSSAGPTTVAASVSTK